MSDITITRTEFNATQSALTMRETLGHQNRKAHALTGHYVHATQDGVTISYLVRECCNATEQGTVPGDVWEAIAAENGGTPPTPYTDEVRLAELRWSFYLGKRADGENVWGELALSTTPTFEDREVTLTDHTTVKASTVWRITTSYVVADKRAALASRVDGPRTAPGMLDGHWHSAGQVGAEEREIVGQTRPELARLFADADAWHLNDMKGACEHMTDEMLTPSDEDLAGYDQRYGRQSAVQKWRLDNVTCPVSGYRYGRAWLAKVPPADLVERIARTLIEAGAQR